MKHEDESRWLHERMQELRARRGASTPAFDKLWCAAHARNASAEEKGAWPAWGLASLSAAVIVVAATLFWTASAREHSRRMERDFATVDGALLMYWQAPSDDILPVGNWNESPDPR